jgi:hypothetical protein
MYGELLVYYCVDYLIAGFTVATQGAIWTCPRAWQRGRMTLF